MMKTKTVTIIQTILMVLFMTNLCSVQAQKEQTETIDEKNNEKIVQQLLEGFNHGAETVLQLFHEDAIIEYPYAHSLGTPAKLTKSQYRTYLKGALKNMPDISFSQVNSYTAQNHVVWAEFHGEVVIPSTNQLYQQDYVACFKLKNGKIIHYKEYWNPMAISAMGGHTEVKKMFTDKSKK